jgi:hypothetical protein
MVCGPGDHQIGDWFLEKERRNRNLVPLFLFRGIVLTCRWIWDQVGGELAYCE